MCVYDNVWLDRTFKTAESTGLSLDDNKKDDNATEEIEARQASHIPRHITSQHSTAHHMPIMSAREDKGRGEAGLTYSVLMCSLCVCD